MKEIIKRENTDNIKDKLMCDKISRKWWNFKRRTEKIWNNFFELEDEPDIFKDMANYKFNPNKPGNFQWQSVDDGFLMVVD